MHSAHLTMLTGKLNKSREKKIPEIVVVGSLHMDLTVKAKTIPRFGETILGDEFKISPGGKGANQAVAAARLGANVTMIGRVGTDLFGDRVIENARMQKVNIRHIIRDSGTRTSLSLIMVDYRGNNIIAVAPGADSKCCLEDVDRAEPIIESSDALLTQLETPIPVVARALDVAFRHGVITILNPSPACELPMRLLEKVQILTPNETEAEVLSGVRVADISSAKKAAAKILQERVHNVVLTMGKKGALIATTKNVIHLKSPRVNSVDTTGAGDAFCGALAVAVSSGKELKEAVTYANCAGALATMKVGAQKALPTKEELEEFMKKNKKTLT